ncbi:apoptotic chromatin condensation inducer in the nucleus-like [Ylistrum balloti]|uniref:apoptotic chromatin condensation inducer in the nucleus-like n=1 Tax=Ylistrum balloti TaxID=509963 RepID=UPI002905DD33|nr:apoptotic chromatin condensation inducer in the nucleus-like [Ylistrum balloti]
MMKYNSRGSQKIYHEDETACGPLCQHPACWQSTNRRIKNIPRKLEKLPPREEIETDLPTVKVCNMLADYGEDSRDHYPMYHTNQPNNMRATSVPNLPSQMTKTSTGLRLTAPASTPVINNLDPRSKQQRQQDQFNRRNLKYVEVQEVFDLEDLNSTWDDTFIAKQYYVWVPKANSRTPRSEKSNDQQSSISQMNATKKVLVKDMTEDMIPRHYEYERYMQARSADSWPVLKKKRAVMSPTYSQYNRRTPYSSIGNSAHDRTAFDTDGIDDLLDLPRDILVKVLDHAKQSDFMSRDRIHEVIERFLPPYDRVNTNMSTASSDLLQQKKMNLHISKARHLRQAHLMETKPVFYLDDEEDNIQEEEEEEEEEGQVTGRVTDTQRTNERRFDSDYGSFRDFYFGGMKDFPRFRKPLPAIGADTPVKIPSISLGLPELPLGLRKTRTFTYNKRNYRDVDFTLAPMPLPPGSLRESAELQEQSEHNSPSQVNIQSPSTPKAPLEIPVVSQEERKVAAEAVQSPTRSATGMSGTPLHAVSPAVSTKVPQAPATTPAAAHSPSKAFFREPSAPPPTAEGTQADLMISRTSTLSPTQNIRAPMNSPRETSPERTRTGRIFGLGLDTIEEKKHEETAENGAGVSRSRSVHFTANEVPEIPPPPSSPQEEDDRSDLTTPLATPVVKDRAGHVTVLTNQNTVNTREPTLTSFDLQVPADRKRESTMGSTPEPWPAVNEADFDVTPSSTKLALHSEHTKNGVANDSRMAVVDPMSDRSSMHNGRKSEEISSNSSAANTKQDDMKKAESPGPPPPSPEAKDKSRNAYDIPKSGGRRRDILSRESLTMTPLMEGDEEGEIILNQGHVKTIVVSVPPLGTAGKPRNKNNRTVDTFVSIDIPAVSVNLAEDDNEMAKQVGRTHGLETTVEESQEDIESVTQTLNTREVPLSAMSSMVDPSIDGQDSMSDMMSAGVAPSQAGNVSPTSTVPDKGQNIDLKIFINGDQEKDHNGKITERSETKGDEDITENGGDHEGFKQELREELEKLQKVQGGNDVQGEQVKAPNAEQEETGQMQEQTSVEDSKREDDEESRPVPEGAIDSKHEGQGQSEIQIEVSEEKSPNDVKEQISSSVSQGE